MLRHDLSYIIAFIVVFGNCTSSVNIKPISPFSDLNEVVNFASIIEPENIIDFDSEINDSATMKNAGVNLNPSMNFGSAPRDSKKPISGASSKRPSEIFIENLVNEGELADEDQGTHKESMNDSNENVAIKADQLIDIKEELEEMGRLFAEKTMGHRYLSNSKDHARNLPKGIAMKVSCCHENQEDRETVSTEDPFEKELSTLQGVVQNYIDNDQPDKETGSGNNKYCEGGKYEQTQSCEDDHVESNGPKEIKSRILVMHFFKIDPKKNQPPCANNSDEQIQTVCINDVPNDSCESKSDYNSGSDSPDACGSQSYDTSESDSGPAPIDFPQGENSSYSDSADSNKNNYGGSNENFESGASECSADSDNNENDVENHESTDDNGPISSPEPPPPLPSPQTPPDNCDDDSDDGKQVITINLYVDSKCSKHPRGAPADYDYVAFLSQDDRLNFLPAQKLFVGSAGKRKRRYNLFSESKYRTQSGKPDQLKFESGEKLQLKSLSSPILFINALRHTLERQKRSMDPKENSYLKEANVLISALNLTSNNLIDDIGPTLGSGTLVNPKYSDDASSTQRGIIDEANGLMEEFGGNILTGGVANNLVKSNDFDGGVANNLVKSNDFDASLVGSQAFGTKDLKNENFASNSLENNFVGGMENEVGSKDLPDDSGLSGPRHYYSNHLAKPFGIIDSNEPNNPFQKNFINLFPSDDETKDHVSFYCDEPDITTQISNTTQAATTVALSLANSSTPVLAAANAVNGIANFNQNESMPSIANVNAQADVAVANFEPPTTEFTITTTCENPVYDKLGVYVVHGDAKKHQMGSENDEETRGEDSGSKENGDLFNEEDNGQDDSDSVPNVLDLVSNATTLSPGAVSASAGAVSLHEVSVATLAPVVSSSGMPTTGTAQGGTTATGSSTQPPKSIKNSVMAKLQNLQRDLKLVFEVQNILNGAKKKNPESRRKRDTKKRKKRRKSVKSKRCKHRNGDVREGGSDHLYGSSNLDSEVRQLGKIFKFKQQDDYDSNKVASRCGAEEKWGKSKRFLFKKKKKKRKKKKSFWHRIFGSSIAPSHFLGNPQNFH